MAGQIGLDPATMEVVNGKQLSTPIGLHMPFIIFMVAFSSQASRKVAKVRHCAISLLVGYLIVIPIVILGMHRWCSG